MLYDEAKRWRDFRLDVSRQYLVPRKMLICNTHIAATPNIPPSVVPRIKYIKSLILKKLLSACRPLALCEKPDPEFYKIMRELSAIGNRINQLAAKANALFGVGGLFWVLGVVDGVVEPALYVPYLADRHQPDIFLGTRYCLLFRLTEEEAEYLCSLAERSGHSRQALLQSMVPPSVSISSSPSSSSSLISASPQTKSSSENVTRSVSNPPCRVRHGGHRKESKNE